VSTESLPCGCPIESNLFETDAGTRVLITLSPHWDGEVLLIPGKAWCSQGHGWVRTVSDVEYERLAAVTA
jgi:hypothetical protein